MSKINDLVRLSKSDVGINEISKVNQVIQEGYLGIGKYVKEFELSIKNYLQTNSNVICVNSGTAALHLALQAAGIGQGDEVLVPSITYVATYQAISATGAVPVSCDVSNDNLFIDIYDAEKRITKKTKAIVPVHYASNSKQIPQVYDFAKNYKLRVIEDAAHSFGCIRDGIRVGSVGDIVCFSFDGIKNITSGEGGAIITKDKEVYNKVNDLRLLGVKKDTENRYQGKRSWHFEVDNQGWRYHMSNLNAAIGLSQIELCENKFKRRLELVDVYLKYLSNNDNISFLNVFSQDTVNHIFPILVDSKIRDRLKLLLMEDKIETGIHYQPNHLLKFFRSSYNLPVAEKLSKSILSIPLHSSLSDFEQGYVIERLIKNLKSLS